MTRVASCLRAAAPLLVVALGLGTQSPAHAQPTLAFASPGAVVPGKTTELTLHGGKLDQPVGIWSSFPAQIELVPGDANQKDKTTLLAKITLAAGAPCGIGGIAISTAAGASDVLLVMIDELPSLADNGNNHTPATAQELPLPVAVDGACDGTTFDYYRFAAKAGQRITCEVVATRLGWDFDPVVRVLDAAGNELLRGDDDPATGADARFVFVSPADGQFVLELGDNRYKPGGRYRLRIGDFPLVTTPLPLTVTRGAATPLGFTGPLTEGIAPLTILAPAGSDLAIPLSVRGSSGQPGWTTLRSTDLPIYQESAASKPGEATPAAIPGVFAGRLEADQPRDLFQFAGVKGTPVAFHSVTRSAGSGAILMLRLLNAAGTQVAQSPIGDTDEPVLTATLPEDGAYRLSIEELALRGGPDYSYAAIARTGPHFTLSLKNDANSRIRHALPAGVGAFHLDVQCQRFGYDGPIALGVDSPRSGWQLFQNVIPAKANEVRLYVVAPLDLAAGELAALRIVGRPDGTGTSPSYTAMKTTGQLRAARPQQPYPPAWLDGLLLVSGLSSQPSFYNLATDRTEVHFLQQVGETKLTLTFDRTDPNFKDVPLSVLPLGLPAGIAAEVKRSGNGPKETYEIVLKGPQDLAEGQHAFRYFAFTEMGTNGRAVQSGDIRLNVVTPLAITVAPAGPLVVGQKQKVKLTLTRRGDDRQPVDLKFKAFPPGVTGPEKTTLTADQQEIEIELAAAADAPPVKFEQLVAVASGKVAGVDVSVESAPVALEIKAP
ncbi:MAG: hypothetical protein WD872_07490 [Pirellulaceae bacterium]